MSCTPSNSARSLSPSNESRFVPRPSIVSSIMERHFPAETPQPKGNEPDIVADDEKSGIVGATICFTPQSCRSVMSPPRSTVNSVETEEDVGSVETKKGGSDSSEKVATDDRDEFELLDGIESKGSLKVEELDVDEEVADLLLPPTPKAESEEGYALKGLVGSPPSNLPSADDDELKLVNPSNTPLNREDCAAALKAPFMTEESSTKLEYSGETPFKTPTMKEESSNKGKFSDGATPFETPLMQEATPNIRECPKAPIPFKTSLMRDETSASPNKREYPKTPIPFKTSLMRDETSDLQHSDDATPFSRMTKSMLSHMAKLGKQDSASVDGASSKSSKRVDDTPLNPLETLRAFWENRVDDKTSEVVNEAGGNVDPSSNVSDLGASVSNSVGGSISSRGNRASLLTWIGGVVWNYLQSLVVVSAAFVMKIVGLFFDAVANDSSSGAALAPGPNDNGVPEEIDADVKDSASVNLSALFSDADADAEKKSDVDDSGEVVHSDDTVKTQATSLAFWKSYGAMLWRFWKGFGVPIIVLVLFVSGILSRFFGAINTLEPNPSDHVCLTTNTTSYESVHPWEIDLSQTDPTHLHLDLRVSSGIPKLFFFASIAISLLASYVYGGSDIYKKFSKKEPTHFKGIWTAQEHEQFRKGFEQHGSNWKQVTSFVPTRNYDQVKAHGIHWKKIGSPETMKRSKRICTESATSSQQTKAYTPVKDEVVKESISKSFKEPVTPAHKTPKKVSKSHTGQREVAQSTKKETKTKAKRPSRHSM